MRILVAAALAVLIGLLLWLVPTGSPKPSAVFDAHSVMAPMPSKFLAAPTGAERDGSPLPPDTGGPNLHCGPDATSVLQNFLSNLPVGTTTVTFPRDACYTVGNGLILQNLSNLTIRGNGAIFNQWPPASASPDLQIPVLFLTSDTNITITGLNIQGAWDGTSPDHGDAYEGKIGMLLTGDTNIAVTDSTIQGTQGDGFSVQLPTGPTGAPIPGSPLNHNVTLSDSSEVNIGWSAVTAEAINNLVVVASTFTNFSQNDFEVDFGSTTFDSPTSVHAHGAAQDNITFANDVFTNPRDFFWTSLQGDSAPAGSHGVVCGYAGGICIPSSCTGSLTCGTTYWAIQQMNVTFSGDVINCGTTPCAFIQVLGVQSGIYDNRFLNIGLTITHDTLNGTAKSTSGGGPCTANYGSTMTFSNANTVQITDNVVHGLIFPSCVGNSPALAALQAFNVNGLTVTGNDFTDDVSVVNPAQSSGNTNETDCQNVFGLPVTASALGAAPTTIEVPATANVSVGQNVAGPGLSGFWTVATIVGGLPGELIVGITGGLGAPQTGGTYTFMSTDGSC